MISIGYYYTGNSNYLKELKDYDVTILIEDEKYVKELLKYNQRIRMLKYNEDFFDIVLADTDEIDDIYGNKKVVIGNFYHHKKKIQYLDEFDIDKILEKGKENNIKFSIIVPNYNNGMWIDKTIESVINQTYDNWEMYIIDDMSTDDSIDVIKQYEDDRITLIQNEIKLYNGGSRNIGILRAKKSNYNGYLLFIDSDDWLAHDKVLERLNMFIDGEDLITLDYQYFMDNKIQGRGTHNYYTKDNLFMTYGAMCAVWCKCFKVSVAPLFEFNTLMEDRIYHYRLVNRIKKFKNFSFITHTWNKMNTKSITSNKKQKYKSSLQANIEWNNCAYRHIAGMLDLLNELEDPMYIEFIQNKIKACKEKISNGVYEQY